MIKVNDGPKQTRHLFGTDLIYQEDDTETRFLLVDGLGSVRTEMVSGMVEAVTTYGPYGKLLVQTGANGTVYGFTGEQYDSATDLLFLRARYYNLSLKMFMSKDPWPGSEWQPMTLQPFTYAGQNPVNRVDYSGMLYCEATTPGCANWVLSTLDAIDKIPNPIGKQLVDTLWAYDIDVKILQWIASCGGIRGIPYSTMRGFGIKITNAFPLGSGTGLGMATRPTAIYVREKYYHPPHYTPPGPPDDDTLLLFAHELVHVKQKPLYAFSIFGEVQAYQIQAKLRTPLMGTKGATSSERDANIVDLNNPRTLMSELIWWRSQHSSYNIVPLLPGGLESNPLVWSHPGPIIHEFQQLFPSLAPPLPPTPTPPPTPPIPSGPPTPPPTIPPPTSTPGTPRPPGTPTPTPPFVPKPLPHPRP